MKSRFVLALAGRGKGRVYAVTDVIDDKYVFIADGKTRRQTVPKRKKLKHLKLLEGYAEMPCTDRELAAQIAAVQAAEAPTGNAGAPIDLS